VCLLWRDASRSRGLQPEREAPDGNKALRQAPEQLSADPPAIRLVVIGNSNSVMRESYVRTLEKLPHLNIKNRSIGSSPSVVLLDYMALEQEWDYDFIIIETAVVDFLQSAGAYTAERSAETLELFIRYVRTRSRAEIVILTIPTRLALLAPGGSWQESVYQNVAERLDVPILDGFRLIRSLVGRRKAALAGFFGSRASRLAHVFGLVPNLGPSIAWRSMCDRQVSSNALGIFSFIDHAHLSPPLHALIGTLLAEYMTLTGRCGSKFSNVDLPDRSIIVTVANPQSDRQVSRTSSLMSRDLISLRLGESTRYQCPPGFFAYGLMMNSAATCCFLHFQSPAGAATFDLHFQPSAMAWIGIVTAILDPVGDGDIVVSVLDHPDDPNLVRHVPNTMSPSAAPVAEIGELILVRRDWRDVLPSREGSGRRALQIDLAPWAERLIAGAASSTAQIAEGIEAENRRVEAQCFAVATNILRNKTAQLSLADRSRLMLLLGMTDALADFVEDACGQEPGNSELDRMRALLRELNVEDEAKPKDLLERAYELARSGATLEAEQVFADGMARFPGEIAFFIQSAWIPQGRKDWGEAKRRWQTVIDCFPNHPVGYLGLVNSLAESGDRSAARDVLASAASRFPDNAEVASHYARHEVENNCQ
jgi:TolA-binding protein